MRRSCVVFVLLSAATAATIASADACDDSYTLTGASPSTVLTTAQINAILKAHNDKRRSVMPYARTMPMLKWDQNLANYAQSYISQCPSLTHSPAEARMDASKFGFWYVGENLAAGTAMSAANGDVAGGVRAVDLWAAESVNYNFAIDSCTGQECRHYTQVVWADSTRVGCGWAACPHLKYINYWSCVYGSGGNIVGQKPYAGSNLAGSAACTADRGPVSYLPSVPPTPPAVFDACDQSFTLTELPQGATLTLEQINGILSEHNEARRSVYPYAKTMPMIQWDEKLAEFARDYLGTCPGLVHSSAESRLDEDRTGYWYIGENIAAGTWLVGPNGGKASIKLFNDELQHYTYPMTCEPEKECFHYTQDVWAETTHVGCAFQQCNDANKYYWSCNYGTGGNIVGQAPYESTLDAAESATCSRINGPVAVLPPPIPPGGSAPDDACDASYLLTTPPAGAQLSLNAINGILRAHNSARRAVQPMASTMPLLQWDQRLANFAAAHLSTCPGLVHTSGEARQNKAQLGYWYVGENLAAGTDLGGPDGGVGAVRMWLAEKSAWTFPMTCSPGEECWHYTQVVWGETTHVGCARQDCPGDKYRYYWSCTYGTGGNFVQEDPYPIANDIGSAAYCSAANGPRTSMP